MQLFHGTSQSIRAHEFILVAEDGPPAGRWYLTEDLDGNPDTRKLARLEMRTDTSLTSINTLGIRSTTVTLIDTGAGIKALFGWDGTNTVICIGDADGRWRYFTPTQSWLSRREIGVKSECANCPNQPSMDYDSLLKNFIITRVTKYEDSNPDEFQIFKQYDRVLESEK